MPAIRTIAWVMNVLCNILISCNSSEKTPRSGHREQVLSWVFCSDTLQTKCTLNFWIYGKRGLMGNDFCLRCWQWVNEGTEIVSDRIRQKMRLKKSKTALLCVDLQKCYYTHPTTQHFPNLEKVWSNSHVNSRWMQFVNQRWSVACSATSERPRLRLCMLCRRICPMWAILLWNKFKRKLMDKLLLFLSLVSFVSQFSLLLLFLHVQACPGDTKYSHNAIMAHSLLSNNRTSQTSTVHK